MRRTLNYQAVPFEVPGNIPLLFFFTLLPTRFRFAHFANGRSLLNGTNRSGGERERAERETDRAGGQRRMQAVSRREEERDGIEKEWSGER